MLRYHARLGFLAALLLILAGPLFADSAPGLFVPEVVTEIGRSTDQLYRIILWIVIVIFVGTEGLLVFSLVAFRFRPDRKAQFFHGSTSTEIILALIPALILVYITLTSYTLWKKMRFTPPKSSEAVHVQVLSEQFAWNFRYMGADGVFGTADDVLSFNQMAIPANKDVIFHISAKDVIHSFFLPESRQKQDAVPGLLSKVWIKVDRLPVWDREAGKRVLLEEKDYAASDIAVAGYDFKSRHYKGKAIFFQQADSSKINYLDYYYERNADPVQVVKGGAVSRASVEPKFVRHHFEIGCAQLCGTSHFAMRGEVLVLPAAEFEQWQKAQAPDSELSSKWASVWDKYHPEFNKIL